MFLRGSLDFNRFYGQMPPRCALSCWKSYTTSTTWAKNHDSKKQRGHWPHILHHLTMFPDKQPKGQAKKCWFCCHAPFKDFKFQSQKCNFWHHHTTKSEEKADSSWWMAVNHEIAWMPSPPLQPCSLACAQEGSQNLCSSRTGALGASVHLTQRNWDWMHAEEGVDRRRAKWLRASCSKASPNVSSSHRSLWVQLHARDLLEPATPRVCLKPPNYRHKLATSCIHMISHDLPRGHSFGTPANNRACALVSHGAGEQTKYTLRVFKVSWLHVQTKGWQS